MKTLKSDERYKKIIFAENKCKNHCLNFDKLDEKDNILVTNPITKNSWIISWEKFNDKMILMMLYADLMCYNSDTKFIDIQNTDLGYLVYMDDPKYHTCITSYYNKLNNLKTKVKERRKLFDGYMEVR